MALFAGDWSNWQHVEQRGFMSRKTYHKGNVRDGLIEAAERLLKDEGLAALSLRRVAREVGVAPSAVYNHFRNREALLVAVAADGYHQLEALEQKTYSGTNDPEQQLRSLARAYLHFAARNPDLYRLMFSQELAGHRTDPELGEAGDTSFRLSVEWWYGEGSYDPSKSAIRHPYALTVWSTLHGAAMQMVDGLVTVGKGRGNSINGLADAVISVLIEGLRPGFPKKT
jgi:AcrR family transcriptional regulator